MTEHVRPVFQLFIREGRESLVWKKKKEMCEPGVSCVTIPHEFMRHDKVYLYAKPPFFSGLPLAKE